MQQPSLSRRRFTRGALVAGGAGLLLPASELVDRLLGLHASGAQAGELAAELIAHAPVARFWTPSSGPAADCSACHDPVLRADGGEHLHQGRVVKCLLCAQACSIADGARGRCRARVNQGGVLKSLVYGRPIAVHVDKIEKKPFFHFLPGSDAFSLATSGCPLRCKFCQNWQISQASPEDYATPPQPPGRIAGEAAARGLPVIAFTYNEPTVFTEYLLDIAREAKGRGVRSVLVSCGLMNQAPLDELCDALAAIKIDLKGFSEEFYRDVTSSSLAPVLRSIRQVARRKVHLELVNLVVPTLNDSERMLDELARWVAGELGPDVPLHFTRFHPDYQLGNLPPTPVATLERARESALARGLRYVYLGNVPGHAGENTTCPQCKRAIVVRRGFEIEQLWITGGACAFCKAKIPGVWS